jgi:cell division protein FtsN
VRRAGAAASAPAVVSAPSPAPAAGEGGQTLHRVRVGAFTDRAAATAAARELESKGFKPYIARGDQ